MKKIIIVLLIGTLTGCGIFKKVEKSKATSTLEENQSSKATSNEQDTSKKITRENWKITIPQIDHSKLQTWQPGPMPDLNGSTKEMKDAYMELRDQYKKLAEERYKDGFGAAMIEIQRVIAEQNYKQKSESKSDSSKISAATTNDNYKKEPSVPGWVIIAGLLVIIVLAYVLLIRPFKK
jgi:hypothetical protein